MKLEYLPDTERIKITPANNMETRGIKNWFNRYVDNYMFDPAFKNKLWDGKRTKYNVEDDTIPMGLWKEAYKCCEEFGYTFEFVNKHEFPLNRKLKKDAFYEFAKEFFNGFTIDGAPFEFRDYQLRCAYNILKNRYCNIAVATAGGKTLIYSYVLFYLMKRNPKRKFLLIVPSKTLVSQFYDDIHAFNWRGELDINIQEVFGADEKPRITDPDREPNIVIGTFQSLVEYPKSYFQQFYSVTTDECLHPDSLVSMADGTVKKIANVKIGDFVKTINEKTCDIEDKPVKKLHKNLNKGKQMYELEMADGTKLRLTGNHKVYTTSKKWIRVDKLRGDEDISYIQ